MLRLAVKARLPLIWVETDDPVNVGAVLSAITNEDVPHGTIQQPNKIAPGSVSYLENSDSIDWSLVYQVYAKKKASLIVVGGKPDPAFFEAGFITAPRSMIRSFVERYAAKKEQTAITNALSGLSFKQAVEISKLAMTKKGKYTARAVQDVRRRFFGSIRGLESVNTRSPLYQPSEVLTQWMKTEGPFVFAHDCNELLRPRGLLFGGPPGTGKTEGAKYIAETFDQPLYRLDIGIIMSKWAGESEQNLRNALRQSENCSPCVLLIDEVEKLFSSEDEGVSTRLLASLLWWLQEHRTRVFTVMTTNKEATIPPELIRPGRIDQMLEFPKMSYLYTKAFMQKLRHRLTVEYHLPYCTLPSLTPQTEYTHAEATAFVMSAIKAEILKQGATG